MNGLKGACFPLFLWRKHCPDPIIERDPFLWLLPTMDPLFVFLCLGFWSPILLCDHITGVTARLVSTCWLYYTFTYKFWCGYTFLAVSGINLKRSHASLWCLSACQCIRTGPPWYSPLLDRLKKKKKKLLASSCYQMMSEALKPAFPVKKEPVPNVHGFLSGYYVLFVCLGGGYYVLNHPKFCFI